MKRPVLRISTLANLGFLEPKSAQRSLYFAPRRRIAHRTSMNPTALARNSSGWGNRRPKIAAIFIAAAKVRRRLVSYRARSLRRRAAAPLLPFFYFFPSKWRGLPTHEFPEVLLKARIFESPRHRFAQDLHQFGPRAG